ncbi:MAG: type 4a pilus biogenesis protein PilO [Phycisphaerae bacterium]|nr:type 4a pilus biogenesis protein PilO [Phycisphaerae bacterium]MDD5380369.1 type 4a pilus biogenesis protein PilO [Phycisphaerae bacterium]
MTSGLRKAVFFVLLVGVAYAAYQYMIKPANRHLTEQKARLATKLANLSEFEKATAAAEDLSHQLEQLQEAVEFFESKLPPTIEIDKVLGDITVIGEKQGVKCRTIRRLEKKDNSGYVEQLLEMKLEGDFDSFYSFLLELEKLPRIMKVRKLELVKQEKSEGQIAVDFVVSIFFQSKTG